MTSSRRHLLTAVTLKDIPKVKNEIRAQLPLLKPAEIRRHKIPYSEAVVLELREENAHEAAEYFEFLFDLDEETRNAAGPNTVIWKKPRLRDNNELIDRLRGVLTNFYQSEIPATVQAHSLIEMALYVQNLSWEWWWIAETLYRSGFWIAKEIEEDLQTVTILRYLFARFLFFQMKNANAALEYARDAQRDSREKPWSASKYLGIKQESLFRECCTLLHKVLLSIARDVRENEAHVAVNSCKVALSSATESGHEELVAEARYELGKSEVAAGNVKGALIHFCKCLAIMKKIPDPQGICRAHSALARAHEELGDDEQALEHLQKFKDAASQFHLPYKLAEAHYLTGEFYLNQGIPKEATPNLEYALLLYNQLSAKVEASCVRCLAGVSKGQEMMEAYQALIKQSVEGDFDAIVSIVHWKDRGEQGTILARA